MKTRPIQRKLLTILLALCMVLSLVPMVALAAPSAASDTADFTVQGGTPAIDLLNQYRTGTGISSWDNSSKTLTLRGIDFTTTAQTAVKLPAGATVVLADGSVNAIRTLRRRGQRRQQRATRHGNRRRSNRRHASSRFGLTQSLAVHVLVHVVAHCRFLPTVSRCLTQIVDPACPIKKR